MAERQFVIYKLLQRKFTSVISNAVTHTLAIINVKGIKVIPVL
jgi:hypothetical protein